ARVFFVVVVDHHSKACWVSEPVLTRSHDEGMWTNEPLDQVHRSTDRKVRRKPPRNDITPVDQRLLIMEISSETA
ncbi:hypothetical protein L9F63_000780, partial [Diploptera punctata]